MQVLDLNSYISHHDYHAQMFNLTLVVFSTHLLPRGFSIIFKYQKIIENGQYYFSSLIFQ